MLDFLLSNDALSAIVAFALVLIPAILIHELGHFLAAKAVGITVLEFGLGFPPRAVTLFRHGATEYTLNWLPIGGFVRPLGEDFVRPVSDEQLQKDRAELKTRLEQGEESLRQYQQALKSDPLYSEKASLQARGVKNLMSVNEAKPLARIFFMAAGSLFNLVTAVLLFMLIALSGLPTVMGGSVGVANISPDSPLADSGLMEGDLIETLDGEYFQNSSEFFNQLQALNGETVELTVQRGTDAEIVPLTFDLDLNATSVGEDKPYVFISNVAPDSPAAQAGIGTGDVITAFNGVPFETFDDLAERTQVAAGSEITLTLLRDGQTRDVQLTPRRNPPAGQGAIGIVIQPAYENPQNGIVYVEGGSQQALVALPFGDALSYGLNRIWFFVESLVRLPVDLINGITSPEEARLISPLGISQIGAVFLQRSIEQDRPVIILEYIAIISVALGITNLLPLPMLDGGRILFVVIEIIRGRPISPEREGMVHLVGMALLLSLIVITFLNDVINPVTNLFP